MCDLVLSAFGKEYQLNKTLLALQSEYFWTLFHSEFFDNMSANQIVQLGNQDDLPFDQRVWELLLDIIHFKHLSDDSILDGVDLKIGVSVMHAVRYLQVSQEIEDSLFDHFEKLFLRARELAELDADILLEMCQLFDKRLVETFGDRRIVGTFGFEIVQAVSELGYHIGLDFCSLSPKLLMCLICDCHMTFPGFIVRFTTFEEATRPRGTDEDTNLVDVRKS